MIVTFSPHLSFIGVSMKAWHTLWLMVAGLFLVFAGQQALAQNSSEIASPKPSTDVYSAIGETSAQQTPLHLTSTQTGLPVKVIYEVPNLDGEFKLRLTLSKKSSGAANDSSKILSQSILFLENVGTETDAIMTYPGDVNGLLIEASLRDENENLVLQTAYPLPVLSQRLRILKLTPPASHDLSNYAISDFTGVETISGQIILPPNAFVAAGSTVHVQLLENALAGGLSVNIVARDSRPIQMQNGAIRFLLRRNRWQEQDEPDLAFKAWIADPAGRKSFVMRTPIGYNGPEIKYSLRLDNLRQGNETELGRDLNLEETTQTIVLGEAAFNPVNGMPEQALLKIKLKQDRGEYKENPILTERTLVLQGKPTRIGFSLETDSIHFDPYAPAPILSVSLTDVSGRVYYDSGEIEAREGQNFVQLFPS